MMTNDFLAIAIGGAGAGLLLGLLFGLYHTLAKKMPESLATVVAIAIFAGAMYLAGRFL